MTEDIIGPVERVEPMARQTRMGISVFDENCICVNLEKEGVSSLRLNLYDGNRLVQRVRIPSMKENGAKDFFSARLYGKELKSKLCSLKYDLSADGEHFVDPGAEIIAGSERFGKRGRLYGRISDPDFDWDGEHRRQISSKDLVIYEAHVRGFTRHSSSGVAHPGTFDGMREKIPYLKKLGINAVMLMPVYEFNELGVSEAVDGKKRINYWGYTKEAYYKAPKTSYSSDSEHPDKEFKTLVKELHAAGISVFMDFYFSQTSSEYILDCLRHYSVYYHIDGFRVISDSFDLSIVREDPVLKYVRFFSAIWEDSPKDRKDPMLFELNDGFKEVARRFVKSDEGQVESFYRLFRMERDGVIKVNYITAHDGFTLRDLISYDIKHNEANGENNRDGTDYNFSWNCGYEGPTRRKSVLRMRERQEKNILVMLLLGLPVPMFLMGDEFGNSQKGNNNAYCQDNATTWLDWSLFDRNKETYELVRYLLRLRKELPIYKRTENYVGFDHKGAGAPDISNHSKEPWNHTYPYYCRELGVLFYGPYLDSEPVKSYYFAFNMHWEPQLFYLPDITKQRKWKVVIDTASVTRSDEGFNDDLTAFRMEPRSVALFECQEDEPVKKAKVRRDAGHPDRRASKKKASVEKKGSSPEKGHKKRAPKGT
ncbi:MAG: alpha-amylase [Eubacterium sp.]|nr:alpha-amylase [Eubacterium sp.]